MASRRKKPDLTLVSPAPETPEVPIVAAPEAPSIHAQKGPRTVGPDCSPEEAFEQVRAIALDYCEGHLGTLLWINHRCVNAGMHGISDWWLRTLDAFYSSGKLILAADVGLRGAKSVTICRTIVNDALFMPRELDPGAIGVIPIMSSDRTEATDRFHTIKKILHACGVGPKKEEDAVVHAGGLTSTYTSSTLPSGGGVIRTVDSQGHNIEFRVYPAKITGAVGYTGVAGFCDEVDLWPVDLGVGSSDEPAQVQANGRANPADVVLDRLLERFTTTRASAHLYVVSASYRGKESAHARKIAEGDTMIQFLARLGEQGAEADTAARRKLAETIGSADPRLLTPADPRSPYIPAWVTNPAAPIETCYALSRERIGPMFGRYGGVPDEDQGDGQLSLSAAAVTRCAVPSRLGLADLVIGVAPAVDAPDWGIVAVGIADGYVVTLDATAPATVADAIGVIGEIAERERASLIACSTEHEQRLRADMLGVSTARDVYAPPLVAVDVSVRGDLLIGPLRALLDAGRLRVGTGCDDVVRAIKGHREGRRSVRVEALCVAVARLLACYPWAAREVDEEPLAPSLPPKAGIMIGNSRAVSTPMTMPRIR